MSLVVAKKYKDYIEISADSIIICGSNMVNSKHDNIKLHTNNKNYILGSVGYMSDGQLLNEILKNNNKIKLDEKLELFDVYNIYTEFKNRMLQISVNNDDIIQDRLEKSLFILINYNNIYCIRFSDILYSEDAEVIGVKYDAAYSYLSHGSSPKETVELCLKDCIHLSAPVYTYRYYFNRKNNKIEEVK